MYLSLSFLICNDLYLGGMFSGGAKTSVDMCPGTRQIFKGHQLSLWLFHMMPHGKCPHYPKSGHLSPWNWGMRGQSESSAVWVSNQVSPHPSLEELLHWIKISVAIKILLVKKQKICGSKEYKAELIIQIKAVMLLHVFNKSEMVLQADASLTRFLLSFEGEGSSGLSF